MATSDLITALVLVFAVARMIQLVAADTITEPFRQYVYKRFGVSSLLVELIGCPWCLGWWFSVALALSAKLGGLVSSWPATAIMIPAVAYGAVMVGTPGKE